MKNLKKLVLTGIAAIISATSFGQFTLSGEIRPRAEYRKGFKKPADSAQQNAFFIDQRTRLNLDYKIKDYQFFVAIQDVRVWGGQSQLVGNEDYGLSIHEAWAQANFNEKLGLKLGRQEIILDDHRIFGNVGWAQQARSHDAAILKFKTEKTKLDFGVAFNQDPNAGAGNNLAGTDYTVGSSYRDMQYLWFNQAFGKKVNMSLLAANIGQQVAVTDINGNPHKSIQYVATLGTHTKFNFDKFKASLSGYYQMGSAPVSPAISTSAYLIGLDLNYQVAKAFSIGLGYETQSGTNPSDTTVAYAETARNFNPMFGTNHKFNGLMDYFYVGNGHGNVGLQDAYLKLKFSKGVWSAGLDVHMFMTGFGAVVLDNDQYTQEFNTLMVAGDATGAAALDPWTFTHKSNLGTELDLSIGTKINKSVAVKAGYSMMFASPTLYTLKGVTQYNHDAAAGTMAERELPMNSWGYVMVIFKPTFLTVENKEK